MKEFRNHHIYTDCGYNCGNWSLEEKAAFDKMANDFLRDNGWHIVQEAEGGKCARGAKNGNTIYCHPEDFSGMMDDATAEETEKAMAAAGFKIRYSKDWGMIYSGTEEEIKEKFFENREEIENMIVSALTTKRRNLVVKEHNMYRLWENVFHKYGFNYRIPGSEWAEHMTMTTDSVGERMVKEILSDLVKSGRVLEFDEGYCKAYRARTAKD